LLNKIRNDTNSDNPFVPVIMVTAHGEADRVIEARDAGMTEYLTKPISAKGLYQRIASIVESERPFVRVSDFFGPDRRRKKEAFGDSDRRATA
jgi:DNA-binding response OmpR family regulator